MEREVVPSRWYCVIYDSKHCEGRPGRVDRPEEMTMSSALDGSIESIVFNLWQVMSLEPYDIQSVS